MDSTSFLPSFFPRSAPKMPLLIHLLNNELGGTLEKKKGGSGILVILKAFEWSILCSNLTETILSLLLTELSIYPRVMKSTTSGYMDLPWLVD